MTKGLQQESDIISMMGFLQSFPDSFGSVLIFCPDQVQHYVMPDDILFLGSNEKRKFSPSPLSFKHAIVRITIAPRLICFLMS